MNEFDEKYNIFEDDSYLRNPTHVTVYGVNYDIDFFKKHSKEILDKTSAFNNTNIYLLTGKDW